MAGGENWRPDRAERSSGFGHRAAGGPPGWPGAPTSGASGAGEDPFGRAGSQQDQRDGATTNEEEVVDAEIVGDDDLAATPEAAGPFGAGDPLSVALDERDEYLDALRRLQAEFENYKKRVAKQQSDQVARAAASLVDKLLPVLDTLDLAAEHLGDAESTDGKALLASASLLHGVLSKEGLERIDPLGEEFDPNAHEAVGHLPVEEGTDEHAAASGSGAATGPVVAQVMRPGYRWKGSVVRPAMVVVRG
jgi:molecular chaperone GrpE